MKRFALIGNPNSGKTTLFNSLTGATERVGNWSGVTVDKTVGYYKKSEDKIEIVDLPGIYSLSPYSEEEVISRNFIIDEQVDCIINIVDGTSLERNLYLTTQLLELDIPVVIALNMIDLFARDGYLINVPELSRVFGVPVIDISAVKGTNLDKLIDAAIDASSKPKVATFVYKDSELAKLIKDISIDFKKADVKQPLFHAVKLIEQDEIEMKNHPNLVEKVEEFRKTFSDDTFGDDFEALVADARYNYITSNISTVVKAIDNTKKVSTTEKIDKVLTHKIFAIPLLLLIMLLIFHFTFSEDLFLLGKMGVTIKNKGVINFFSGMQYSDGMELKGIPSLGVFLQNWFSYLVSLLKTSVGSLLGSESTWYKGLIVDGLINGMGAVLSFIPQILLIFFFISLLEDSGYMSRVAYILDRLFRKLGLSGKAFIPMITGFGCSVPAILGTRTLTDKKEKNRTIRLITCFSCGAKAPLWALLGTISHSPLFVTAVYAGGIVLAIVLALFMKLFTKNSEVSSFIMELPQYHLPQMKNVGARVWERAKDYLTKAGSIIAISLVALWFLQTFGFEESRFVMVSDMSYSLLGYIGKALRYVFYPLGWAINSDGWKYSVASITGLVAKEQVVSSLALLFNGATAETMTSLTKYGIYAYGVFNLLTIPCVAAISAAKREQTNIEFIKTLLFWFFVSYFMSALVYWMGYFFENILFLGIILLVVIILVIFLGGYLIIKKDRRNKLAK